MFSNIKPFLCSNIDEFADERKFLREKTFRRIKQKLKNLNINFDPIQFDCSLEDDDYVQSGHFLRLLLHNIQNSNPFFICLLGQQYGPYLEPSKNNFNIHFNETSEAGDGNDEDNESMIKYHEMNWIEKNLLIASQTGYSHIINQVTFKNSFLEFQINTALYDELSYPYYRFYYRQHEYLDEKFSHLPVDDRKEAIQKFEAENDYCDFKIKDLKMKIAKKGLIVKYYKTLEQLDNLIYNDFTDMVQGKKN
jgi:hypothetical protein